MSECVERGYGVNAITGNVFSVPCEIYIYVHVFHVSVHQRTPSSEESGNKQRQSIMLLKTCINCSPEYPITIDKVTPLTWMEIKHWLSTLGFLPKVTTLYLSFNNKPLRCRYQQCIHGMLPFQELLVSHPEGSW